MCVCWEFVNNPSESYSHRCSVLDVIFFSQLLTGEAVVLLPESLTLPTGFLGMKQRHRQLLVSRRHARFCSTIRNRKHASLGILSERSLPFGRHISQNISQQKRKNHKKKAWENILSWDQKDVLLPSPNVYKAFENARSHLIKKSQKTDLCDFGFLKIKYCKPLEGRVCCGLSDFCSPCAQCPSAGLAHSTPADLKNSLDDGY